MWAYTSSQFYQCKVLFLPQFDKVLISGDPNCSTKDPWRSVRYYSQWLHQMQRASKYPLGLSFPAPRRVVPVLHRWASGAVEEKEACPSFSDGGGSYFTLDWLGDIGRRLSLEEKCFAGLISGKLSGIRDLRQWDDRFHPRFKIEPKFSGIIKSKGAASTCGRRLKMFIKDAALQECLCVSFHNNPIVF